MTVTDKSVTNATLLLYVINPWLFVNKISDCLPVQASVQGVSLSKLT